MTAAAEPFGTTPDGQTVHRVAIRGGGLSANIITWGAAIQDLRLEGHAPPLVLGFESFEEYHEHSPYFGAVAGRCANRLAHGRFVIDGERFEAERNEGRHTLHGGSAGTAARNWGILERGPDFVRLQLLDPAGWMGFPGNLDISCTYRVSPPGILSVGLEAETDAPTLCSLAQHSYFNLDDGGAGTIGSHRLTLAGAAHLPVDAEKIPTGEVRPVAGSSFDFALPRTIGSGEGPLDYDHNYCLAAQRGPLRLAAWAQGNQSGVEMEVWTTEPGLQFYSGQLLGKEPPGLGGRRYKPNAGFCLEPQVWPDSPNHPYFPQAVLRPGETYRQLTQYRFRLP